MLAIRKQLLAERLTISPAFAARFYRAVALFLSDRLRATQPTRRGNGSGIAEMTEGELDPNVLEVLTEAGARFDRMLRALTRGTGQSA